MIFVAGPCYPVEVMTVSKGTGFIRRDEPYGKERR